MLMPRRTLPPEERRAQIVTAAKRLFAEKGIADTKVSDIAAATGTAQGTFYLYFKSKEEVVGAIADEMAQTFAADVKAAVETHQGSAVAVLSRVFEMLLELANDDYALACVLHHDDNRHIHDEIAERSVERLRPLLLAVVNNGVAEGAFRIDEPGYAVDFVISVVKGFDQRDFERDDELTGKIQAALHFCLRGLGVVETPLPRLSTSFRHKT
jgi:TetR/AcrR family transcriptional regulator, fatty acid metabolism regulator protein